MASGQSHSHGPIVSDMSLVTEYVTFTVARIVANEADGTPHLAFIGGCDDLFDCRVIDPHFDKGGS